MVRETELEDRVIELEDLSDAEIANCDQRPLNHDSESFQFGNLGVVFLEVKVHPDSPMSVEGVCHVSKEVLYFALLC